MTAVRGRQGYKADWARDVISLSFDSTLSLPFRTRVGAFAARQSLPHPRQKVLGKKCKLKCQVCQREANRIVVNEAADDERVPALRRCKSAMLARELPPSETAVRRTTERLMFDEDLDQIAIEEVLDKAPSRLRRCKSTAGQIRVVDAPDDVLASKLQRCKSSVCKTTVENDLADDDPYNGPPGARGTVPAPTTLFSAILSSHCAGPKRTTTCTYSLWWMVLVEMSCSRFQQDQRPRQQRRASASGYIASGPFADSLVTKAQSSSPSTSKNTAAGAT